jgi:hypothetical protein
MGSPLKMERMGTAKPLFHIRRRSIAPPSLTLGQTGGTLTRDGVRLPLEITRELLKSLGMGSFPRIDMERLDHQTWLRFLFSRIYNAALRRDLPRALRFRVIEI